MRKAAVKLALSLSLLVSSSILFAGVALAAPGCSASAYLHQNGAYTVTAYGSEYCQTSSQNSSGLQVQIHLRRCAWKIGSYCASWDEMKVWTNTAWGTGHNFVSRGWDNYSSGSSDTWATQVYYFWDGVYQGAVSSPAVEV